MKNRFNRVRNALRLGAGALLLTAATYSGLAAISLSPIGTYATGVFEEGAAEIVAHDPGTQRVYSLNTSSSDINVLDISDPTHPTLVGVLEVLEAGPQLGGIQSVAVRDGLVAVAAAAADPTKPGTIVFYDSNLNYVNRVKVGALPDMVVFTPDGLWLLVANEGEPSDDYKRDPHGSVSIIDLSVGAANLREEHHVRTAEFIAFNNATLDPSIRIFGPGATVAKDVEPEYIAVSADSQTAWVTLQEANALGVIDIPSATVTGLIGLGFKDFSLPGQGLDPSDRDTNSMGPITTGINIANWPVWGMYMPDTIALYYPNGSPHLVMANEGDSRAFDGFNEETRVGSSNYPLDPTVFPNAADLKRNNRLGRLRVTNATGDTDGDGDFDRIFAFGARSFSIRDAAGNLVFDSGDDFEQITALLFPLNFNASNNNNLFDDRSDDKGPEPEGLALGQIEGRTYAFISLERFGGIMTYDITDPASPSFEDYVTTRNFNAAPGTPEAGDLGPEGVVFISPAHSPNGRPLLVVGNEISGTTTIFEIVPDL